MAKRSSVIFRYLGKSLLSVILAIVVSVVLFVLIDMAKGKVRLEYDARGLIYILVFFSLPAFLLKMAMDVMVHFIRRVFKVPFFMAFLILCLILVIIYLVSWFCRFGIIFLAFPSMYFAVPAVLIGHFALKNRFPAKTNYERRA